MKPRPERATPIAAHAPRHSENATVAWTLAGVGPLLWLLASRRRRQQAQWRAVARQQGLVSSSP